MYVHMCWYNPFYREKQKTQQKPLLFEISPEIYDVRNASIIIAFSS